MERGVRIRGGGEVRDSGQRQLEDACDARLADGRDSRGGAGGILVGRESGIMRGLLGLSIYLRISSNIVGTIFLRIRIFLCPVQHCLGYHPSTIPTPLFFNESRAYIEGIVQSYIQRVEHKSVHKALLTDVSNAL